MFAKERTPNKDNILGSPAPSISKLLKQAARDMKPKFRGLFLKFSRMFFKNIPLKTKTKPNEGQWKDVNYFNGKFIYKHFIIV